MTKFILFLSSTIEDLREERDRAKSEILSVEVFDVIRVEDLPASDMSSRRVCLDEVASVDAVVLIIGSRYGFVPADDNPHGLSVTHLEFRRAKELRKPVFAFIEDSSSPEKGVAEFIKEVSDFDEGVLRRKWSSVDELGRAVRQAVLFWLARQARDDSKEAARFRKAVDTIEDRELREFPLVLPQSSSLSDAEATWLEAVQQSLLSGCAERGLPLPKLVSELAGTPSERGLQIALGSIAGSARRLAILSIAWSDQDTSPLRHIPAIKLEVDDTPESVAFAARCAAALMFAAVDDPRRAFDELFAAAANQQATVPSAVALLSIAGWVSAFNSGKGSLSLAEKILERRLFRDGLVDVAVMALTAADLRLRSSGAVQALKLATKTELRLLLGALQSGAVSTNHLYNLARRSMTHFPIEALRFYEGLLEVDSSYEERWYLHRDRGLALYGLGQLREAGDAYDRACHLKNTDSEMFRQAGDAYYYRGRWSQALMRYIRAVELEAVEDYFLDWKITFCQNRVGRGTSRDRGFALRQELSRRLTSVGTHIAEWGGGAVAIPMFRLAVWLSRINFDANCWLALYANRRSDFVGAAQLLRAALAVKPEDPEARLNLVVNEIFAAGGTFDDASRRDAQIAVFHGGPGLVTQFGLRLINTENKEALRKEFEVLTIDAVKEHEEWRDRRAAVLKPEEFDGVSHLEFRP